jgi:hypothetical protein
MKFNWIVLLAHPDCKGFFWKTFFGRTTDKFCHYAAFVEKGRFYKSLKYFDIALDCFVGMFIECPLFSGKHVQSMAFPRDRM